VSKNKINKVREKDAQTDRASVADVLGPYLRQQCEAALAINAELETALPSAANLDDVDLVSADQIHDLRVAYRRLRSVIKVFGEFLSVPESGRIADDARWFTIRLGAVRDLDVLGARLPAAVGELPGDLVLHQPLQELAAQLRYRRTIALAEVRDALHSETYAALAEQLRTWQHHPPWVADAYRSAGRLKKCVKRADQRVSKRLARAAAAIESDDPETDELIHAVRKAGKQHRYAVEATTQLLGPATERTLAARKELQDYLGDYQDSVLATALLRDLGGIPGRNGFTFGLLYAGELQLRRQVRKALVKRAK
jgi:CHAD domain-containing protein